MHNIELLVTSIYGVTPGEIERMTFGHSNVVYGVSVQGREIIIRTNDDPAVLRGTGANLSILAQLGLPVPEIVKLDLSKNDYPFAYIILNKISGCDLRFELHQMTQAQMTALAETILLFQKKVGALPLGSGYGWVPIGEKGPFNSWFEIIQRDINAHIHHVQSDLSSVDIQTIYQMMNQVQAYCEGIEPVCFLDDITIKNVIMQSGELQGIIDFDWVCYGDPLYMIGLTLTAIVSDIDEAGALFYIEELCRIRGADEEQRAIIHFYSLIHGLQFIGRQRDGKNEESAQRLLLFIKTHIQRGLK